MMGTPYSWFFNVMCQVFGTAIHLYRIYLSLYLFSFFRFFFPYRLFQNIKYSSLCDFDFPNGPERANLVDQQERGGSGVQLVWTDD